MAYAWERSWQAYAEAHGGAFVGSLYPGFVRTASFTLSRDGCRVEVRHVLSSTTRVLARYRVAPGPCFELRGPGPWPTDRFYQPLTRHPEMDARYRAVAGDLDAVRRVWTSRACTLVCRIRPPLRIEADGSTIDLTLRDILQDEGELDRAVTLAVELAQHRARDFEELCRGLGQPRGDLGSPGVLARIGPRLVELDAVASGTEQLAVRARARAERMVPRLVVRLDDRGQPVRPLPRDLLGRGAGGLLQQAGPGTLTVRRGEVELTIDGHINRGRIEAAAGAVAEIAAARPASGAFR